MEIAFSQINVFKPSAKALRYCYLWEFFIQNTILRQSYTINSTFYRVLHKKPTSQRLIAFIIEYSAYNERGDTKKQPNKTCLVAQKKNVGVPGFEPGKAGPESAVLPLHHTPREIKEFCISPKYDCKISAFYYTNQIWLTLFFFSFVNAGSEYNL